MKVYTEKQIVDYARANCPYYTELYKDMPIDYTWDDIPFLKQEDYWSSELSILSGPHMDGQIFKSGGTTGEPKYAHYSQDEWETFCEGTAMMLPKGGLKAGDRIGNLFHGGGMYASFLYVHGMLYASPAKVLQFSLGDAVSIEEIVSVMVKHQLTAIAGLPSMIMKIVEYINVNKVECPSLEVIYFAGESFYPSQKENIKAILGKYIEFRSANYASNDGGLIGYYHADCVDNEHRVCDTMCKVELLDEETGEVILEKNRPGKIYITALYRTLQPVIRYPAGDRGVFTEDPGPDRKFRLLGRSDEGARVGYAAVAPDDIREIVEMCGVESVAQQLIITRKEDKDLLTIHIATTQVLSEEEKANVLETLERERPIVRELTEKEIINQTELVFCTLAELEYNPRTGKLKAVIDRRC